MTYRRKVAKVKTQETAWKLVTYLEQATGLLFQVVLPSPDVVEVQPRPGSPLRTADWTEVDNLVERFKNEHRSKNDEGST